MPAEPSHPRARSHRTHRRTNAHARSRSALRQLGLRDPGRDDSVPTTATLPKNLRRKLARLTAELREHFPQALHLLAQLKVRSGRRSDLHAQGTWGVGHIAAGLKEGQQEGSGGREEGLSEWGRKMR